MNGLIPEVHQRAGMRFRALFIGGPVDGQERVLASDHPQVQVAGRGTPQCVYRLLFAFGESCTLVYSLYGVEETLNRLWRRYAGEDHA
jgi:hypothetical protein